MKFQVPTSHFRLPTSEKGIVLITALLGLLVLAIFLPALLFVIQNETKWAVKLKKSSIAFHMAEAGLDRGIWKLQESDWHFTVVSTGGRVEAGYTFDTVYVTTGTDGTLGEYKIKLTTGTAGGSVKIQSIGRDKSTDEVRALESVYTKTPINAGLQTRGALTYKPALQVHWGPVVCFGNVDEEPNLLYPRKIVKGSIKGNAYCGNPVPSSHSPPYGHDFYKPWPDSPSYDYNCFQKKLGNAPDIKLEDYRELARNSRIHPLDNDSGGTAVANPVNSGYFPAGQNIALKIPGGNNTSLSDAYIFRNSTSVIFVEDQANFGTRNKNSQLVVRGLIMPNATLSFNGDTNFPDLTVKIPVDAQKEYLYSTGANAWTTAQGNNATAFSASGEGNDFTIADVAVHGYCYFKDISNAGTNLVVVGILDMQNASNPSAIIVYFDASISTSVLASNVKPSLQSWREVKLDW